MRRQRCYLAMRAFLSRFGPPVALMAVIFYLSAQPGLSSGLSFDFYLRKAAHMGIFGALALAWWRALGPRHLWPAIAITLLYAVSDEMHQHFVPDRHGSAVDVGIDAIGVLIAVIVCKRAFGYIRNHDRHTTS